MTNNNLDERASTTGQIYPKEKANPNPKQKETIFILCESCYWSATYFGKFMLPAEERSYLFRNRTFKFSHIT